MPSPSRPHLLLPSPQGLLHYDVVEETAFLGPAPRGGLHASPEPFPQAKVVIRVEVGHFQVNALPGEPPPEVDGVPDDGAVLRDGSRIKIGEFVALFRLPGGAVAAHIPPAHASASAAGPPPERPRRGAPGVPEGSKQAGRALLLSALLVFGFAAYETIRYLQTPGARAVPSVTESMTRVAEPPIPRGETAAANAFAAAEAYEAAHPADREGIVARYAAVARNQGGTAAAERAGARVAELWPRYAAAAWPAVREQAATAANQGRYRRALAALDEFDAKFAGTPPADEAFAVRGQLRTSARAALDGLRQRAAPLFSTDPTRAYRLLYGANLELPADLEAELGALMTYARSRWDELPGKTPPAREASTPPTPAPPRTPPPTPGATPPAGNGAPPTTRVPPGTPSDDLARTTWMAAHQALLGRRWAEARAAYDELLGSLKDTALVRANDHKVRAGRRAADVGVRGPVAFCSEDASYKDGRLTAEWQFDGERSVRDDFDLVEPFGAAEPVSAEVREGRVVLSGSTALLPKVVFDPADVSWEMDTFSEEPQDFGLLGLQEGRAYRACAMHVGNTRFRLKKGSAAKVLAGHVLWLFGDGVWRDADPGERGFVRLAVRDGNQLKPGERFRVHAELRAGQMTGEIHAKSDPVDLKGPLKGDDGVGIGPLRVGPFTYGGRVGVERFRVSGKVDAAWLEQTLDDLAKADPGPE